ncbi:hypothetical protein CQ12_10905 [Bradyrhizobium jicamae]|uniref:Uncharacterized protein n=1 Tax=Bradyrhizobium jicamae TaxID=280332 RepID=A0A0R3M338_9BRAD|nr:hypothetical protein [Bradyrhizobium jicamae]KRR14631.1 hypothetical protein CQ12_10905 [Bradyrhizobium jicamae]
MRYFEEARTIWKTKVPSNGQADTVEGELLRAVEKLRWEAQGNGNINWDDGFEILVSFLQAHLLDATVYPDDVLTSTRAILSKMSATDWPVVEDGPYDELGDRVVEWYLHYGTRLHAGNPKLLR